MAPEMESDSDGPTSELWSEKALLEKYELGKLLGCGASAKVYHARNIQSRQSVAIKCISKNKIVGGCHASQIKREISIMGRLHHPHIVKLSEVLATKTKIYFVMEYAKGGELFNEVARKQRLSENLSRRYFQQLISAVGYCHSSGVFHRDLKPENLLLDENGDLKVSDFGLSAVSEQTRNDGLLHTLCGTPAYVAPEILVKKGYDGAKVDIWSCGVILYVLNAGFLPFNDSNLMAMYRKIYRGQFRCPTWMSPDLQRLLSRILDPNPATRITIGEVLNHPWVKKGFKEVVKLNEEDIILKKSEHGREDQSKDTFLNAFDIISFSSGFDLSGLFCNSCCYSSEEERFITGEPPEKIIERMKEIAKKEGATVTTTDLKVAIAGQNGKLLVWVEVYRLTQKLAVVEVRPYERTWLEKLRSLVYDPESPASAISAVV